MAEPAQTRYMTMSEVSDSFELMKSMGMSAQASVKTIGVEVSGKAAFSKSTNITGYSSNFVMNATVENGVRYAGPAEQGYVRSTPEAVRLARDNLSEFEHQCGDSFVSSIYSGAKLTAVITIETSSQKQKQKLSAELSSSGWGADFKSNMNKQSSSTYEKKNMSLSIFQTGGRGDGIPKSKEDLFAKLDILPAIAFDAPKDFHMAITPYESLANWPAKPLVPNDDEFTQLASYWGAYNSLYDEFQLVLDKPEDYTAPMLLSSQCVGFSKKERKPIPLTDTQVDRMARVQDDILDSLLRLQNFAQYCTIADEKCEFPEAAFRHPTAFRAQLPLEIYRPVKDETSTDTLADDYTIQTLSEARIARPAKRRCQADKDDPMCLSNYEIEAWEHKLGFELKKYDNIEDRDLALSQLNAQSIQLSQRQCKEKNTGALFASEPGFPAIWYHPHIATCMNNPGAQCTLMAPPKIQAVSETEMNENAEPIDTAW